VLTVLIIYYLYGSSVKGGTQNLQKADTFFLPMQKGVCLSVHCYLVAGALT